MKLDTILGDMIVASQPNNPEWDFTALAGDIFPHYESGKENNGYEYIPSNDPVVDNDLASKLGYEAGALEIGSFERKLLWEFVNDKERFFCLVGHMGSGKSSTLNHIMEILKRGKCANCWGETDECHHKRIVLIDFAKDEFPSGERNARDSLARMLFLKLKHTLEDCSVISDEEEFTLFWNAEVIKVKDPRNGNRVFEEIREALSKIDINRPEQLLEGSPDDIKKRKSIREEIIGRDVYLALKYYFCLWNFVLARKFDGVEENLIIFFDNIDHKSPSVQSAFVQLIDTYATRPGPRIIIALRPETIQTHHIIRGKNFIGGMLQDGTKPIKVILHFLKKFVREKRVYYDKKLFSPEKIDSLAEYFTQLIRIIETRQDDQIFTFFENTCGPSIRLALKIAEGFLTLSEETVSDIKTRRDLRIHHVIKRLFLRKDPIFSLVKTSKKEFEPFNNVFRVDDFREGGGLLVKTRILQILRNSEFEGVELRELRAALSPFNYTETDLIRTAINELLMVFCQLIRSTDRDGFLTEEEFQGSGSSRIWITKIGIGYLNLIEIYDYVETLMYDCRVPRSHFSTGRDIKIMTNHLLYLFQFVEILCLQDIEEIKNYFEKKGGYDDYIDNFGMTPVSIKVLGSIYQTVKRIISSELAKRELSDDARLSREDIIGRFNRLVESHYSTMESLIGMKLNYPMEYLHKSRASES